ncbi:16S rRNA (uracil(1498)-N(3))-methyltransferase [Nitrincola sp. MINF-07-Sa-05]|uniref:16S rRNA (uracil(1498)-N(3))-methyltransferase n=1 Tax=Nitrincola salilacus TaxID=3400273 RepID=UPI003917F947
MRIPRFHEPQPLAEHSEISLSENTAQHAIRVLRLRVGDELILFNGDGHDYYASISAAGKRDASVRILHREARPAESPLRIELGQTLSRGERMDFAVQKATELGCAVISPLFTERCEVKLTSERQDKRQRHWQQIAISACEQSQRNQIPDISHPQPLADWLDQVDADLKLVLHHHDTQPMGNLPRPESVALLIGPEGGLTEDEVTLAKSKGFIPVCFGPRVMRTETAPIVASAILQYLWGDLG